MKSSRYSVKITEIFHNCCANTGDKLKDEVEILFLSQEELEEFMITSGYFDVGDLLEGDEYSLHSKIHELICIGETEVSNCGSEYLGGCRMLIEIS